MSHSENFSVAEAQLMGILSSAMDAIITIDDQQHIILFNSAAEKMFGYSATEALGQSLDRLIPKRVHSTHKEHVQIEEIFGLRSNGEEFPMKASISQFEHSGQKCLAVILRDITKRKEMERDLHTEREFTSAVLETTEALIVVLDYQGRIVRFNHACEMLTGYSVEEVQGKIIWDFLLPSEEISGVKQVFRDLRKEVLPNQFENRWVTKDNKTKLIAWSNTILANENGKVEYVIGTGVDITKQKQAEVQTQQSEKTFRTFLENCPLLAWIKDCEGRYLYVNPAWEPAYNHTLASCMGKTDWDLWPPEVARQLTEHDSTVLSTHESLEAYESVPTSAGEKKEWMVLKFPLEGLDNQIDSIAGFAVDLTQLNQLKGKLHQAEQRAQLGTLAAGLAHEIGTPMNIILGRSELLLKKTSDDVIQKGLTIIVKQIERITKLMNQLLRFTRRGPLEPRLVDVRGVLGDAIELIQDQADRSAVKVEPHCAAECPFINGDPDQLEQVFLNLLMNAIHAMPEGGVLRIGVSPADSQMRVTIADTGIGIRKEDLSSIFEPFFTTKPTGKGTGLGLMVAKNIIEEHAGSISVVSESGHGTIFTILLPCHECS